MSPASILKWLAILLAVIGITGLVGYAIFVSRGSAEPIAVVSQQTVVNQVRGIGRLELAHFRLTVTQAASFDTPLQLGAFFIPRKSKVLVIAVGEAIGCLDLAKLDSTAISISDSTVRVRLPAPEVCVHKLDMSKSEVYSAEFSLLLMGDETTKAQLIKGAFKNAEDAVLDAALKQGILPETEKQAELLLKPLLMRLGFKRVEIERSSAAKDR